MGERISREVGGDAVSQYMLIFSLGSVQAFIEQARKTRDLWLGSFLIAQLMEAAMREVEAANLNVEFVYPADRTLKPESDYATLPHKYVAIFDSLTDAQTAVEKSESGMSKCWDTLRQDVWKGVIPEQYKNDETLRTIWDMQSDLGVCFETYWVIVEGSPASYNTWLRRAEDALDARKRLKDFQFRQEPGEKSTISGEREALHGRLNDRHSIREQVKDFWKLLAAPRTMSAREISKDGSERLDAVDTIKRFASKSSTIKLQAFPSTSSIATATFVERLLALETDQFNKWLTATDRLDDISPDAIPYLEKLQQNIGKHEEILKRDGDCFFKETFTTRHLEKDHGFQAEVAAGIAGAGREGLCDLFKATDKESIRRPTPYYAIVKMDGDRMGDFLGTLDRERHEEIGKKLSSFAREAAPQLIEGEYPGRLVYAGGDDVLALVPLARDLSWEGRKEEGTIHTLLDLIYQLRLRFGEITQGVSGVSGPVTSSAGIAVAHHYTPLSAVLRATREAERLAKDRYNRDSLVVTIMRRSGEQTRVGCHWRYDGLEEQAQPVPLFLEFYQLFDQDILSPKCIFTLLEEAPALVSLAFGDEEGKQTAEIEQERRKAQASEVRRVLRRQLNEKKKDRQSDASVRSLAQRLVDLAAAMDKEHPGEKSVSLHEDTLHYGLVEVLGWLLVMAFLTRREED
jgi:CRISPR-associated protein Cmr2